MQDISTVQKVKENLCKSSTQDNCRYKTVVLGICVPVGPLCWVINTTAAKLFYTTEGDNNYRYGEYRTCENLVWEHKNLTLQYQWGFIQW